VSGWLIVRDLRAALAGRVVVCATHDDLAEPGDTVISLRTDAPVPTSG
jgi:ATP-binding cassette, subfamily C, bacterial CydCD